MVHRWLPNLSERLVHTPKSYPVLVHGFPTLHSPPHDCHGKEYEDLAAAIFDDNADIITDPATLIRAKSWTHWHGHSHGQAPPMATALPVHGSIILYFMDPVAANRCIDRYIAFSGRLLPTTKYICQPPHCFNCWQTGHITHYSNSKVICSLCAEDHHTWQYRNARKDTPQDRLAPLKCTRCLGPHTASDRLCPAHKTVTSHNTHATSLTFP